MLRINFLFWEWLQGLIDGVVRGITNTFWKFIYGIYFGIIKAIAWVLDLLTQLFFIFAGVTPVFDESATSIDEGQVDIVNFFVAREEFRSAYIYLSLIALGLVIVFAIAKIIKQDYFDRAGPRSKAPIFRDVALSFLAFICVIPIFTFLLEVSGMLAVLVMRAMGYGGGGIGTMLFNMCWDDGGQSVRAVAFSLPNSELYDPNNFGWYSGDTFFHYYINESTAEKWVGSLSINGTQVEQSYFHWYIFIFVGLILILNVGKMMVAMVTRLYKLVAYFIVAPSPISQIVLDGGTKFKQWLKKVMEEALKVVGCVMSFMIFFLMLGAINDLDVAKYAYDSTDAATSISNIIESNNLILELRNDVSFLYYGGTEPSWVDSAINALGKAMLIVAGVGAIADIDATITPLLSGGSSSMELGASGQAVMGAAKAVGGAALDITKQAVGATVGFGLSAVKGARKLKPKPKEGPPENEEKETPTPGPGGPGPETATPGSGGPAPADNAGDGAPEEAAAPSDNAGDGAPEDGSNDGASATSAAPANGSGGTPQGGDTNGRIGARGTLSRQGVKKNIGRNILGLAGRGLLALGTTSLGVAGTAAKAGLSTAGILSKAVLQAAGWGGVASAVESTVHGTIDQTKRQVGKFVAKSANQKKKENGKNGKGKNSKNNNVVSQPGSADKVTKAEKRVLNSGNIGVHDSMDRVQSALDADEAVNNSANAVNEMNARDYTDESKWNTETMGDDVAETANKVSEASNMMDGVSGNDELRNNFDKAKANHEKAQEEYNKISKKKPLGMKNDKWEQQKKEAENKVKGTSKELETAGNNLQQYDKLRINFDEARTKHDKALTEYKNISQKKPAGMKKDEWEQQKKEAENKVKGTSKELQTATTNLQQEVSSRNQSMNVDSGASSLDRMGNDAASVQRTAVDVTGKANENLQTKMSDYSNARKEYTDAINKYNEVRSDSTKSEKEVNEARAAVVKKKDALAKASDGLSEVMRSTYGDVKKKSAKNLANNQSYKEYADRYSQIESDIAVMRNSGDNAKADKLERKLNKINEKQVKKYNKFKKVNVSGINKLGAKSVKRATPLRTAQQNIRGNSEVSPEVTVTTVGGNNQPTPQNTTTQPRPQNTTTQPRPQTQQAQQGPAVEVRVHQNNNSSNQANTGGTGTPTPGGSAGGGTPKPRRNSGARGPREKIVIDVQTSALDGIAHSLDTTKFDGNSLVGGQGVFDPAADAQRLESMAYDAIQYSHDLDAGVKIDAMVKTIGRIKGGSEEVDYNGKPTSYKNALLDRYKRANSDYANSLSTAYDAMREFAANKNPNTLEKVKNAIHEVIGHRRKIDDIKVEIKERNNKK